MRNIFLILISTLFLGGCPSLFEKPKPEIVVKRHYVRVELPKEPIECHHNFEKLKKLPKDTNINVLAGDSAVQRRGRLDDRDVFDVCQQYVKKLARK